MSKITQNTTDLRAILEAVKALPDAGGVGELKEITVTPTTEKQESLPGEGYVGFSKVITEAIQTQEKTVTENGEYVPEAGKYFSKFVVDVPESSGGGGNSGGSDVIKANPTVNISVSVSVEDGEIPNLISPNMNTWVKNTVAANAFQSITYREESQSNACLYNGVGMFEIIGVPVTLETWKTYTFSIEFYTPNTLIGDYAEPYAPYIAFLPVSALSTEKDQFSSCLAYTALDLSYTSYKKYTVSYRATSITEVCVALGLGSTRDGNLVEFHIKNAYLHDGTI